MSQYPQAPPPGTYVPPNESTGSSQGPGFNPQQSQYFQQPQSSSPYQPSTPQYGPPQSHKNSSSAAFGQMFNQAVTTGKPMLNKLGKTISSKLGSKPHAPSTPQHLESYQNYQQHQQQQNPLQAQSFSPQPQQQQWQQPNQQSQPQNTYPTPQQSPYPQSQYATPASGHSGQNNYFPQQAPQAPNAQASSQQPNTPNYNQTQFGHGQNVGGQQQDQTMQGQYQQGQFLQGQSQGQNQHNQFPEQQTGVIGSTQPPMQPTNTASPPPTSVAPNVPIHPNQQTQQPQSGPSTPGLGHMNVANQNGPPAPSHPPSFNATPPPQQYGPAPTPPVHPNQQQPQQQQQQQWTPMAPMSPQAQNSNQTPLSTSPPPPQSAGSQQQAPPIPQPIQQQQPAAVSQAGVAQPAPTEFIAELPADLGNLSLMESSKPQPSQSQYQAYQPPSAGQSPSPAQSFTIPRRAVSMSTLPLADPWRVADPATELPTREFYIIADLLFDALDRKFEPQNTGLLEASKVLESWRVTEFPDEAAQLFAYDTYSAFGKMWSLSGIPHIMVPCQPALMPIWNFQPQSHSQDIKIPPEPPGSASYATYMPALNRAGWYKYIFLELVAEPEGLDKMISAFCNDTYKPSILNQPDLQKQDKTENPVLASRAKAVRNVITKVCQETAAAMQGGAAPQSSTGGMSEQEAALKMQALRMQQQLNAQANQNMINGGLSFSMAAGNAYTASPANKYSF